MENIDLFIAGRVEDSYSVFTIITEQELSNEYNISDKNSVVQGAVTYIVKQCPGYIYYELKDVSNIVMRARNGSGSVVIGMAVPSRLQFANGVSPYDVLCKVKNTFYEKHTRLNPDKSRSFNAGNWLDDHDILTKEVKDVLSTFPTKKFEGIYYSMNTDTDAPVGKVKVAKENLPLFFLNPAKYMVPSEFKKYSYFNISSDCEETDDFVKVNFAVPATSAANANRFSGSDTDQSAQPESDGNLLKTMYQKTKAENDKLVKENRNLTSKISNLEANSKIDGENIKIKDREIVKLSDVLETERKKVFESDAKAKTLGKYKPLFWVFAGLFVVCLAGAIFLFTLLPENKQDDQEISCDYDKLISSLNHRGGFKEGARNMMVKLKENNKSVDDTLKTLGFNKGSSDYVVAKFFIEEYPMYPNNIKVPISQTDSIIVWLETVEIRQPKPTWTDLVNTKWEIDGKHKAAIQKAKDEFAKIDNEKDFFDALKKDKSLSTRLVNSNYYKGLSDKEKIYLNIANLNHKFEYKNMADLQKQATKIANDFICGYVNERLHTAITEVKFKDGVNENYWKLFSPPYEQSFISWAVMNITKRENVEKVGNFLTTHRMTKFTAVSGIGNGSIKEASACCQKN